MYMHCNDVKATNEDRNEEGEVVATKGTTFIQFVCFN